MIYEFRLIDAKFACRTLVLCATPDFDFPISDFVEFIKKQENGLPSMTVSGSPSKFYPVSLGGAWGEGVSTVDLSVGNLNDISSQEVELALGRWVRSCGEMYSEILFDGRDNVDWSKMVVPVEAARAKIKAKAEAAELRKGSPSGKRSYSGV